MLNATVPEVRRPDAQKTILNLDVKGKSSSLQEVELSVQNEKDLDPNTVDIPEDDSV